MRRLLLLVLVLPLAACGGSTKAKSSTASLVDTVTAAAQKTYDAGSESMALEASVDASGQAVVLTGSGSFDTKTARGSIHLDVNASPISTTVDEVLVGTGVYLKSPRLAAGLPGGKTWLKLDLGKLHLAGIGLQSLLAQNPGAELERLQALKSATKVGADQIGTHYRVIAATGPVSGYDVWVGSDGYIRRVVLAQASPKVSVTIDLSKFGEKVTAAAPPAAHVYESKNGSIPGLGGLDD